MKNNIINLNKNKSKKTTVRMVELSQEIADTVNKYADLTAEEKSGVIAGMLVNSIKLCQDSEHFLSVVIPYITLKLRK